MAKPKLTPRQRRLLAAVRLGLPPVALARRFRTTAGAMSTALHQLRAMGVDIPVFTGAARRPLTQIKVDRGFLKALAPHAKRRGVTTRELASQIIRAVLRKDLIGSLLDDGSGAP